jgi:hypothetical protein
MQRIGELGWLDTLAFTLAVTAVGGIVLRALFPHLDRPPPSSVSLWRLAVVSVLAGLFGTLPAALCWEGLPHAYRAIGTYPAVALFTGACLSAVWRRSWIVRLAVLGLAVGQTAFFLPDYFGAYTKRSYVAFATDIRRAAEEHDKALFDRLAPPYEDLGMRYYLVRYFGYNCRSSDKEAQRILRLP